MQLSHEDIQAILRLIDDSPYDELNLQTADFHLALRRRADGEGWQQERQSFGLDKTVAAPEGSDAGTQHDNEPPPGEAGLSDIRAPMAGTFYRAPKPGAPPFVDKGSAVDAGSVVAIIEVMKLMSSIPAGTQGKIKEIHADNGAYVDKDQLLMRVRPAQP